MARSNNIRELGDLKEGHIYSSGADQFYPEPVLLKYLGEEGEYFIFQQDILEPHSGLEVYVIRAQLFELLQDGQLKRIPQKSAKKEFNRKTEEEAHKAMLRDKGIDTRKIKAIYMPKGEDDWGLPNGFQLMDVDENDIFTCKDLNKKGKAAIFYLTKEAVRIYFDLVA